VPGRVSVPAILVDLLSTPMWLISPCCEVAVHTLLPGRLHLCGQHCWQDLHTCKLCSHTCFY